MAFLSFLSYIYIRAVIGIVFRQNGFEITLWIFIVFIFSYGGRDFYMCSIIAK